jgi:hypothetical protein
MTDFPLPQLPNRYTWHGRTIVIVGETETGVPVVKIVATPTPENFDLFMDFLNAWGEMFRVHGFEQATEVALHWAFKRGVETRELLSKPSNPKD